MKHRTLGANGPRVSVLGLGCLSFGGIFGPTSTPESHACLDAAWDHGITFLDVANVYGNGVSESVIGQWLAARPHRPVIATKAGIVSGATRGINNDPAYLRAELEGSLKRLGVDHIDLFYLHRHDPACPIEAVAETMAALIKDGKIGGYGLSEVAPYTLRRAHAVHPVTAVQNEYSLWTRQPELGLIQTCAELGVAFVPFSPLARGAFGDPMIDPDQHVIGTFRSQIPRFSPENWPLNKPRLIAFHQLAADMGHTPAALALAWCLHQGDHLIPIPGTRSAAHLAAWAQAPDITLSAADRAQIETTLPIGWAYGDRYNDAMAASVERYS
ncbi:aldo/keto reductase [Pseudotabrizicola alkalilacus]|uniref:Aldo/keto reductase n=1 Tax=Pseudotabrizicola alkalilacus TaxID=2305252 RepID=A0A411Z137_9RHOB|nr:aldo/keto reductase [Pseudotabrizicola alkalilacus]RGP36764.1 aldo/keto reductase [Pseudotabrizicola alkalilacus]